MPRLCCAPTTISSGSCLGNLGTAATVQLMTFGNLGEHSGTGVAFSRDPSTGAPGLFGDPRRRAGRGRRSRNARNPADRRPALDVARDRRPTRRDLDQTRKDLSPKSSSRSRTGRCGCCRCGPANAARRPPCGSPSTWQRSPNLPCPGPMRSPVSRTSSTTLRWRPMPVRTNDG